MRRAPLKSRVPSAAPPKPHSQRPALCYAGAVNLRAPWLFVSLAGCPVSPSPTVSAPERPAVHEAEVASRVRDGYFGRDWWGCARAGEALLSEHPRNTRLRAWTIACAARAGEDITPLADAMLAADPNEPWGLFARAAALIDDPRLGQDEGIPAARATAAALAHPDATWLLGRALVLHGSPEEAAAFLAEQRRRGPTPELVGLELALLQATPADVGERLLTEGAALRTLAPTFVDGWFIPALWLSAHRRAEEAEPLLAQALTLSPYAPALYTELWAAILQTQGRSEADKRAAIEADIAALLAARGDAPSAVKAAADVYADLSPETAERLCNDLLTRHPDSREAEWVRIDAIRALGRAWNEARMRGEGPGTPTWQALRSALDAFLARPRHPLPALLGEAYIQSYDLLSADPDAPAEALLAAAQGMAAHERINLRRFGQAGIMLIERTGYREEAETIVREALHLADRQETRATNADARRSVQGLRSGLLCALGAVLQAQGQLANAREALELASSLTPDLPAPFLRLAALAEAEHRPEEAERLLVEGLHLEHGGDMIEDALRSLYRRRHGTERGYQRYRVAIERARQERRKAEVLATRVADPKALDPFTLQRLTGGEVRSADLAGQVAVINLWSTTCRPCVAELPAVQKLVDAYAGAGDVSITTINTDTQIDVLPAWLGERGLRFEVLLGERWFMGTGRVLPTTFFVDPQGRVAFVKEGLTSHLLEEFTWRIEAIRQRKP